MSAIYTYTYSAPFIDYFFSTHIIVWTLSESHIQSIDPFNPPGVLLEHVIESHYAYC